MILIQDHTPRGIASQYFGGVIQRFSKSLDRDISYEKLIDEILNGYCIYKFYTIPSTVKQLAEQAKSFNMSFMINNNAQWFNKDISPDFYGKISGACADVLDMLGFNENKAAILVMNEPRKFGNEDWYLDCVDWSNYYVKGRYPLILINDEYYCYNNDYILENTGYIKDRMFGVHLLSCLGYPPEMKLIEFAATTAAKYGIPIICTEGGSWFKSYRTYEGWEVIRKLIEKCSQLKYDGCAIVCPDNNTEGYYPKLGFRIWDKYYKKIIELKYLPNNCKYWDGFEKLLKEIKEKVPIEEPIIEEEDMILVTMKRGVKHPAVRWLQQILEEDYDVANDYGKYDGDFGPATERQVKAYQKKIGVEETGIIRATDLIKIYEDSSDTAIWYRRLNVHTSY